MAKLITIREFGRMLVEAGILTQERCDRTVRIVIDAKAGDAVVIYTQEIAEGGAIAKLAPMLEGMIPDGG